MMGAKNLNLNRINYSYFLFSKGHQPFKIQNWITGECNDDDEGEWSVPDWDRRVGVIVLAVDWAVPVSLSHFRLLNRYEMKLVQPEEFVGQFHWAAILARAVPDIFQERSALILYSSPPAFSSLPFSHPPVLLYSLHFPHPRSSLLSLL